VETPQPISDVIQNFKLLEMILLQLDDGDVKKLLLSQSVSKAFKATIDRSRKLQCKLWLLPDPSTASKEYIKRQRQRQRHVSKAPTVMSNDIDINPHILDKIECFGIGCLFKSEPRRGHSCPINVTFSSFPRLHTAFKQSEAGTGSRRGMIIAKSLRPTIRVEIDFPPDTCFPMRIDEEMPENWERLMAMDMVNGFESAFGEAMYSAPTLGEVMSIAVAVLYCHAGVPVPSGMARKLNGVRFKE
jgi:hypothetical protein